MSVVSYIKIPNVQLNFVFGDATESKNRDNPDLSIDLDYWYVPFTSRSVIPAFTSTAPYGSEVAFADEGVTPGEGELHYMYIKELKASKANLYAYIKEAFDQSNASYIRMFIDTGTQYIEQSFKKGTGEHEGYNSGLYYNQNFECRRLPLSGGYPHGAPVEFTFPTGEAQSLPTLKKWTYTWGAVLESQFYVPIMFGCAYQLDSQGNIKKDEYGNLVLNLNYPDFSVAAYPYAYNYQWAGIKYALTSQNTPGNWGNWGEDYATIDKQTKYFFIGGPKGAESEESYTNILTLFNTSTVESNQPEQTGYESTTDGGQDGIQVPKSEVDTYITDTINVISPTYSAVNSGFATSYAITQSNLQKFADYMWSDRFDLDSVKKLFNDPFDYIIDLHILPISPQGTNSVITIGGQSASDSEGNNIYGTKIGNAYVEINCGQLSISEWYASYLDYSPYTKISLYLPYIGVVPLNTDEVMKQTLKITYTVDVLSGSCVAHIWRKLNLELTTWTIIGEHSGTCSVPVPLTSQSWSNFYRAIINGAVNTITSTVSGAASGGAAGAAAGAGSGLLSSAANIVMNSKPTIQKAGNLGGNAGFLSVQKPYLIIEVPNQCTPAGYGNKEGWPLMVSKSLRQLKGFTQINTIHLKNIPATSTEIEEINRLMKEGVIL